MERITFYEDDCFYYFWKKNWISSTWGKWVCFLDLLKNCKSSEIKEIFEKLDYEFGIGNEFGMLNRLDKETSGLLYFAKTKEIKDKYKQAQKELWIEKIYIADVYGEIKPEFGFVEYGIWNHRFEKNRVVVVKSKKDEDKIKWKIYKLETYFEKLFFDKDLNTTTLLVKIKKGFRHQIRAHLSSIWYPIVNEKIYIKNKKEGQLKLFCIWLKMTINK